MNLPEFSAKRPIAITMLICIIVLFGVIALTNLGLDLMPDMKFPLVVVVTSYEGVASKDVEELLTRPIEEMVGTVSRVKRVYSFSQEGASSIVVEFEWGANIDFAAQDVRDAIGLISQWLPADAGKPLVMKYDPTQMPVALYAVTGMKDTMTLRKFLRDSVAPRIERLDGVAAAMAMGGDMREISVLADLEKMERYGVSLDQLAGALRVENTNVSGGHLKNAYREFLIRSLGEAGSVEDVENMVVSVKGGEPVLLKQVAKVVDTYKERRHYARVNGSDTVILAVMKQSGANTVQVSGRVNAELEELKPYIPADIKFATVFDQADFITKTISQTASDGLLGGILAAAFILLFLQNIRPTIAICLAIPLSVVTAFIGMYVAGYTFNIMTLGGLALGVGMLVDNAVVVIENTFRHLESGKDRLTSAVLGASEVGLAISASTFTTMAVFLPMVLVSGMAGQFSRPMALTVCMSLLASLFVAITIVPMIAAVFFKRINTDEKKADEKKTLEGGRIFKRFRDGYGNALGWALNHKMPTLGIVLLAFAAAVGAAMTLGTEFMPSEDVPFVVMSVNMPVGTNLDETDRVVRKIEDYQRSQVESMHVVSMVGPDEQNRGDAAMGFGASDVNQAMIMTRLKDKDKRERRSSDVVDDVRAHIPQIEGATISFMDMGTSSMTSTSMDQSAISVRIFGKDLDKLMELARKAEERIKKVEGLRDVRSSMNVGKPELHIHIDREKAARMGLSHYQAATAVRSAIQGIVASQLRKGGEEWDIRIKTEESSRDTLDKIKNLSIMTPMGVKVALSQVADFSFGEGPIQIARENQERKVTISADVKDRDVGSVTADIKKALSGMELPEGYFFDYAGQYKDMVETFSSLLFAAVVAFILVYMIMAAQFESFAQPLVIMFTVPLGFIGVVAGLFLLGMTLSVPAFMGFIILMGIVVNNGIIMIDFINQRRRAGMEKMAAIVEACKIRLRPILITSCTTILGILPMGLSSSEGSEWRAPLGVTIAFGLMFSMALTLFVIPCVYTIVDAIAEKFARRVKKVVLEE
jgi:HAE1 family hydrophobic/amphiphilic exporter-1